VKQQARNIDPAVESVRAEAVVGERKAVASFRPLLREEIKTAACLKALIQPAEKTPVEKSTGEASGALNGKAQCRACRRGVKLEIGSLGTISFLRAFTATRVSVCAW